MNTLYFASGADPGPDIRLLFEAIKAYIPSGITISYDAAGDEIDDSTGLLTGAWTGTSSTTTVCGGSSGYAGPAGACITWRGTAIVNGRRVLGKTFLVPLDDSAYSGDGTLGSTFLGLAQGAVDTFHASTSGSDLRVWHRPTPGHSGSSAGTSGGLIHDQVAVLRSRRG